jgi:hypothetical protein
VYQKDAEFVDTSDKNIDTLRKEYDYLYTIVIVNARLIYDNLSPDFIKKYLVGIDKYDAYLLDFEDDINSFKAMSSKDEIDNTFIEIACVMDSLISGWKIRTYIPKGIIEIDDLIWLNCKLAVCVALSLMDLSYDALKDNNYTKRLIELLYICYFNKDYGRTSIIEYEAMILELLNNAFKENY